MVAKPHSQEFSHATLHFHTATRLSQTTQAEKSVIGGVWSSVFLCNRTKSRKELQFLGISVAEMHSQPLLWGSLQQFHLTARRKPQQKDHLHLRP